MKVDFIKFYFYTVGENVDLKIRELKRNVMESIAAKKFVLFDRRSELQRMP
ncbi:hypothetical protein C2845_PM18G07090 [Panicum miliaceum]|uniref:Uncharacterized protein n=1 Tax=Panicum miliaceum TaxID=4540 RepID=A0A3L6PG92_PANMI|nr:hypothetical protein C2845_PM18G07090 [Panicum miliaceum]